MSKTIKDLEASIGGLSDTSKMPCKSWGIPATYCKTGSKLAKGKNTVCSGCYALKGAYGWPTVKDAYQRRFNAYNENPTSWADNMIELLQRKKGLDYFRWFDSGDLQSVEMLEGIVKVSASCPNITFWLPTRELGILADYVAKWGANWPQNLTVRLSATKVDGESWTRVADELNVLTSTVSSSPSDTTCPSYKNHGKCGPCRACWSKEHSNIEYLKH